ncbi:MAG: phosphoenolpyruvate synthase, partial [Lachnospiraceae bacterium]|nr:phosphoenolpyruvate synthase [Lachnospiraceae bacterium]
EDLRSKGVWIFCVFREYLLSAGRITGLNDNIFMLTFDELFEYLKGNTVSEEKIIKRRESFDKYRSYETFPNIIVGRFDPEKWMSDEQKRYDVFVQDMKMEPDKDADIKGFAGAAGIVKGKVRVIKDIEHISEVNEGDILVTSATNVGWTPVFSKVSAIVTDIGAPLSHAAIVARECGIPAVVGCGNATTLLHTGDEVIVDGSAGSVKITDKLVIES